MKNKYRIIEVKEGDNKPEYYVQERILWYWADMHRLPKFSLQYAKDWLKEKLEIESEQKTKRIETVVWEGNDYV